MQVTFPKVIIPEDESAIAKSLGEMLEDVLRRLLVLNLSSF